MYNDVELKELNDGVLQTLLYCIVIQLKAPQTRLLFESLTPSTLKLAFNQLFTNMKRLVFSVFLESFLI